ncbi:hypothetical protein [Thermophilibacter sp.]
MRSAAAHTAMMMAMSMEMPKPGHSVALCRAGLRVETGRLH